MTEIVDANRADVAGDLRDTGYSRLSNLLSKMTPESAPSLQALCLGSLPATATALGLSACVATFAHAREGQYRSAVRSADVALTLLGPIEALLTAISILEAPIIASACTSAASSTKKLCAKNAVVPVRTPGLKTTPVTRESVETLERERFDKQYFQTDVPVVISGLASDWPAARKWTDSEFMGKQYGHRTVPVETARGEQFVTLSELLVDGKSEEDGGGDDGVMYLAQHPLLDYIPTLREDIKTPKYVTQPRVVNVWMGSAGSGSVLHFDTYDNFLVQVSGVKVVVLVPVSAPKSAMYIRSGATNVSDVDPRLSDEDLRKRFPKFSELSGMQVCTLKPGDALFIPSGHWHWVRSETQSISVNFWFT